MKKTIFFVLCLLTLVATATAQIEQRQTLRYKARHTAPVLGLKGGFSLAKMKYNDDFIKDLSFSNQTRPDIGVFFEMPFCKYFSMEADLLIAGKGVHTKYTYKEDYNVDYKMRSTYGDIRLLFIGKYPLKYVTPYIFAAPALSMRMGGTIDLEQRGLEIPFASTEIGDANLAKVDFSVYGGIGVQKIFDFTDFSLVTKVEIGYNFGLLNTYSQKELDDEAVPLNVYAYNAPVKDRFNRCFEILFSIGIPLHFESFNCYDFGNVKY